MDLLSAEMEEDRKEEKEYALADERQKTFMEWRQVWDAVKYGLIVVALFLVLVIQIVGLCKTADEGLQQKVLEAGREASQKATEAAQAFWKKYLNATASDPD
jgi:flagellar biosynthesis/type III secretory pathway M-ring protein FliF/YscJ